MGRMIAALVALCCLAAAVTPAVAQQTPVKWATVNSELGVAYPLDQLENTIQFTLESAAVASRFAATGRNVVAQPGKRLLILTGSLTNIQTHEYPIGPESVAMFVFSETGERSLSSVDTFGLPDLAPLHANLKPKEKVRFVTVVQIHAEGAIKRLAVRRGNGRVAWYDVQKDLTATDSVFLKGLDLAQKAETSAATAFDFGAFDMQVESAGPVSSADNSKPDAASRTYAVTLKVTNVLKAPEKIGWQYATPSLADTGGTALSWNSDLIDSATGKTVGAELEPGKPYLLRYVFSGDPGRTVNAFTLTQANGGRTIAVALK
jgi:hypothetical protein